MLMIVQDRLHVVESGHLLQNPHLGVNASNVSLSDLALFVLAVGWLNGESLEASLDALFVVVVGSNFHEKHGNGVVCKKASVSVCRNRVSRPYSIAFGFQIPSPFCP